MGHVEQFSSFIIQKLTVKNCNIQTSRHLTSAELCDNTVTILPNLNKECKVQEFEEQAVTVIDNRLDIGSTNLGNTGLCMIGRTFNDQFDACRYRNWYKKAGPTGR